MSNKSINQSINQSITFLSLSCTESIQVDQKKHNDIQQHQLHVHGNSINSIIIHIQHFVAGRLINVDVYASVDKHKQVFL